jgi:peroxiredoxin
MNEGNQSIRRVNLRTLILIVLMVVGIGIIVLLQLKDSPLNPSGKPLLGEGVPAPNFSLPDLEGKKVNLTDFKGKVVLLNIWATWCAPCVEEMPSMEKLYQELKGEDFELLAISVDEAGAEAVKPFMEKHKLGFPVLLDTKGEIKNLYQATGVPESFIIDKYGMIVGKIIGPRDWADSRAIRYFRNLIQSN